MRRLAIRPTPTGTPDGRRITQTLAGVVASAARLAAFKVSTLDICDGLGGTCTPNGGRVYRSAAGICDVAERCPGNSAN
jgi:hypothetical protein